jgi:uncharacterized heparinase superfamily protein
MNLLRLLRTVRYLRPVQVYGRISHRFTRPRPDLRSAPARSGIVLDVPGAPRPASMLGRDRFRFLNVTATPKGWDDPTLTRLWRYNLHYFDDLNADGAVDRSAWHHELIGRWITENPPGHGTGWESYPTSLRIVNWVRWASRASPDPAVTDSLAVQARWLSRRLERHILGNHLWANGKALAFAGAFFVGPEADAWLRTGLGILDREIDEQILPDGGHFERSPMYQAILLEDILDLLGLDAVAPSRFDRAFVAKLRSAATRMARWLRVMTHPDGRISFFNDAGFGIAPKYEGLAAYATRMDVRLDSAPLRSIEALPDSGYVRLTSNETTIICDVAPIGPDYLPGHAHADTLSFELSHRGRRVFVNSGTSTYDTGAERMRQRGTAAHNTVLIDDADSSEIWGSFRVARRARPGNVAWSEDHAAHTVTVAGSHDGYSRLPGAPMHSRSWTLNPTALIITDVIAGRYRTASARFHIAPELSALADGRTVVLSGSGVRLHLAADQQAPAIEPATWHPEFGVSVPNQVIVVDVVAGNLRTIISWT